MRFNSTTPNSASGTERRACRRIKHAIKLAALKPAARAYLVLACTSLLCCAAFTKVEEGALKSDRALVRSPDGDVFVIEFGKKRHVADFDTEEALLISNRSQRIQRDIFLLAENEINSFQSGEKYPSQRINPEILIVGPTTAKITKVSGDPKLLPDGLLVRSPQGQVFLKQFGTKRKLQDPETEDALLTVNRAKNLQTEVISLTEEQVSTLKPGDDFPLCRAMKRTPASYKTGRTFEIPQGWRAWLTLGFHAGTNPACVFHLKVQRVRDDSNPDQETMVVTGPDKMAWGFVQIILEQRPSAPAAEPLPSAKPSGTK